MTEENKEVSVDDVADKVIRDFGLTFVKTKEFVNNHKVDVDKLFVSIFQKGSHLAIDYLAAEAIKYIDSDKDEK